MKITWKRRWVTLAFALAVSGWTFFMICIMAYALQDTIHWYNIGITGSIVVFVWAAIIGFSLPLYLMSLEIGF